MNLTLFQNLVVNTDYLINKSLLIQKFSWHGYGIYNILNDIMLESENHSLDFININSLSKELNIQPKYLNDIVYYCIKIGLFKRNIKSYWNPIITTITNKDIKKRGQIEMKKVVKNDNNINELFEKSKVKPIKKTKRFVIPIVKEIQDYINANNFNVDAEYFFDFYESKGWKIGSSKMINWKATIRNWNRRENKKTAFKKPNIKTVKQLGFDINSLDKRK